MCAHFCYKVCIEGYLSNALSDLGDGFILHTIDPDLNLNSLFHAENLGKRVLQGDINIQQFGFSDRAWTFLGPLHEAIVSCYTNLMIHNLISHNAPFCNTDVHMRAHFWYKMVHCGIFVYCLMGLWDGSNRATLKLVSVTKENLRV